MVADSFILNQGGLRENEIEKLVEQRVEEIDEAIRCTIVEESLRNSPNNRRRIVEGIHGAIVEESLKDCRSNANKTIDGRRRIVGSSLTCNVGAEC